MTTENPRPYVTMMELSELRDGCTALVYRLRRVYAACPSPHGDPQLGERIWQVILWLEELEQDLEVWQES